MGGDDPPLPIIAPADTIVAAALMPVCSPVPCMGAGDARPPPEVPGVSPGVPLAPPVVIGALVVIPAGEPPPKSMLVPPTP